MGRLILALIVTFALSRWTGIDRLEKQMGGKIAVPHCSHCRKE
nr:hypothetical protein [Desulforamulus aquiferis]